MSGYTVGYTYDNWKSVRIDTKKKKKIVNSLYLVAKQWWFYFNRLYGTIRTVFIKRHERAWERGQYVRIGGSPRNVQIVHPKTTELSKTAFLIFLEEEGYWTCENISACIRIWLHNQIVYNNIIGLYIMFKLQRIFSKSKAALETLLQF